MLIYTIELTRISITNGDIVADDEVMRASVVYSIHVYISLNIGTNCIEMYVLHLESWEVRTETYIWICPKMVVARVI